MVRAPRIIFWETTKECNLKCSFCRMEQAGAGLELSTQEAFGILRDIKSTFGTPLLVLSGGEPLLRKDIFKIIFYASEIGLPLALASNGVLLGKKEACLLKKAGVRQVSLSIDSVDAGRHDLSRKLKGAFGKTKEAALVLREQGVAFQINYTVTKLNKDEIRLVAMFALSIGAVAVHYFVLVPVGCGKEVENEAMLDADDNEEVLSQIRVMSEELPIQLRPTCAPQYARFVEDGSYSGCLAGSGAFFISARGDVYPCGYLPVVAGSLRESSVGDIWKNAHVFASLRRNNLKGACGSCYLKDRCRGCRARAFGITKDYLAEDMTCVLAKDPVAA